MGVDLVDFGGGNLGSLRRCLHRLDVPFREGPPGGDRPVLLPGVGAFGAVMRGLRREGLDRRLIELVQGGTPLLGICVGLQVLFEGSEESPEEPGLGLLAGRVLRFHTAKVPQIGWNLVEPGPAGESWPTGHVYFVNSYYARPEAPEVVLYESHYGDPFCAAVRKGSLAAFQFHPEKSGDFGQALLRKWIDAHE